VCTEADEAGRPHVQSQGGISRRRIIQGAAWSAPVIVLATAVPATAASGDNAGAIVNYNKPQLGAYNGAVHVQLGQIQHVQGSNPNPAPAKNVTMVAVIDRTLSTMSTTDMVAAKAAIVLENSPGWVVQSVTFSSVTNKWTVSFLYGADLPRDASTSGLNFAIPAPALPTGSVSVSATAISDGVSISASFTGGNTGSL
jgi:hypothetical protein